MMMNLEPGRIVEYDGELYLVEQVRLRVDLQRIESASDIMEEVWTKGHAVTARKPVFVLLEGTPDEGVFSGDRFKILYTEDEL